MSKSVDVPKGDFYGVDKASLLEIIKPGSDKHTFVSMVKKISDPVSGKVATIVSAHSIGLQDVFGTEITIFTAPDADYLAENSSLDYQASAIGAVIDFLRNSEVARKHLMLSTVTDLSDKYGRASTPLSEVVFCMQNDEVMMKIGLDAGFSQQVIEHNVKNVFGPQLDLYGENKPPLVAILITEFSTGEKPTSFN